MTNLMQSRIQIPCPECGRQFQVSLGDVKGERTVYCPSGHSVKLVDQNDGIRKFDHAMEDFQRRVRRIGR